MKDYLLQLSKYNIWANQNMHGFIVGAGEAICLKEQKSSFTTIRETMAHTKVAQEIWLHRLMQITVPKLKNSSDLSNTDSICAKLVTNSVEWYEFISSLNENELTKTIKYSNTKGTSYKNSFTEVVFHVMNHSTFHRGQMVTMLRNAGYSDLHSTDLITWFRLRE